MGAIRHIRQDVLGMSQTAFARSIGVNQATVSRWESGALEPGLSDLRAIRELAMTKRVKWRDAWLFEAA